MSTKREPIKSFKTGTGTDNYIGVFDIKVWWTEEILKKCFPVVTRYDYVVGRYTEYDDGQQEAFTTIAICREIEKAFSLFKTLFEKESEKIPNKNTTKKKTKKRRIS